MKPRAARLMLLSDDARDAGALVGELSAEEPFAFVGSHADEARIVIARPALERRHFSIRRLETGFELAHVAPGSTTSVNGRRVEGPTRLRHRDVIGAGPGARVKLRFEVHDASPLDDVVRAGTVLMWPVEGTAAIHRAIRGDRHYEEPLEVLELIGPSRAHQRRALDSLRELSTRRIGLFEGESSTFIMRASTRGARVSELLALAAHDGGLDPAAALVIAQRLGRATGIYRGVRLEDVAVTFEGEIVVAEVGPPATDEDAMQEMAAVLRAVPADLRRSAGSTDPSPREWLAQMVKQLFPARWAWEERWREEVALLDDEARRRLMTSGF